MKHDNRRSNRHDAPFFDLRGTSTENRDMAASVSRTTTFTRSVWDMESKFPPAPLPLPSRLRAPP